jgi:hypothetical protein
VVGCGVRRPRLPRTPRLRREQWSPQDRRQPRPPPAAPRDRRHRRGTLLRRRSQPTPTGRRRGPLRSARRARLRPRSSAPARPRHGGHVQHDPRVSRRTARLQSRPLATPPAAVVREKDRPALSSCAGSLTASGRRRVKTPSASASRLLPTTMPMSSQRRASMSSLVVFRGGAPRDRSPPRPRPGGCRARDSLEPPSHSPIILPPAAHGNSAIRPAARHSISRLDIRTREASMLHQEGQVFELKSCGRNGTRLWAYRYRVGGRGSRRVQRGGFASEQGRARARTGRGRWVDAGPQARNAAQRDRFQATPKAPSGGGGRSVDGSAPKPSYQR